MANARDDLASNGSGDSEDRLLINPSVSLFGSSFHQSEYGKERSHLLARGSISSPFTYGSIHNSATPLPYNGQSVNQISSPMISSNMSLEEVRQNNQKTTEIREHFQRSRSQQPSGHTLSVEQPINQPSQFNWDNMKWWLYVPAFLAAIGMAFNAGIVPLQAKADNVDTKLHEATMIRIIFAVCALLGSLRINVALNYNFPLKMVENYNKFSEFQRKLMVISAIAALFSAATLTEISNEGNKSLERTAMGVDAAIVVMVILAIFNLSYSFASRFFGANRVIDRIMNGRYYDIQERTINLLWEHRANLFHKFKLEATRTDLIPGDDYLIRMLEEELSLQPGENSWIYSSLRSGYSMLLTIFSLLIFTTKGWLGVRGLLQFLEEHAPDSMDIQTHNLNNVPPAWMSSAGLLGAVTSAALYGIAGYDFFPALPKTAHYLWDNPKRIPLFLLDVYCVHLVR